MKTRTELTGTIRFRYCIDEDDISQEEYDNMFAVFDERKRKLSDEVIDDIKNFIFDNETEVEFIEPLEAKVEIINE